MKSLIRVTCLAVCAILFLSGLAGAGLVYAGDNTQENTNEKGLVFMGIKYASQDIDMLTQFTRRQSGVITEESSFDNNYSANSGGLFVGYTMPYQKFYLSGQIFFDVFNDEFDLSAGSSRFKSSINHAFGMDLMPGVYLYKGVSVFGKLGLANGDFDFVKSSPTSTTYDANRRLFGFTLGLGLAYDITPSFTAKIGYERTKYEETEINVTLGTRTDKTMVEPRVDSFFLTLQYNFN
jgi:opacity protein-like surface antigen